MRAVGISLSGIGAGPARPLAGAERRASGDAANGTVPTPATANLPVVWRPARAQQLETHARLTGATHAWRLIPDLSSRYADIAGMIVTHRTDMVGELSEQIAAKLAMGANVSVLRTVERIEGRFVDYWA